MRKNATHPALSLNLSVEEKAKLYQDLTSLETFYVTALQGYQTQLNALSNNAVPLQDLSPTTGIGITTAPIYGGTLAANNLPSINVLATSFSGSPVYNYTSSGSTHGTTVNTPVVNHAAALNATSGTVVQTATSSAVNAVRNWLVHMPGAVRDYVTGAGSAINPLPVAEENTFATSDRDALLSDVVATYLDLIEAAIEQIRTSAGDALSPAEKGNDRRTDETGRGSAEGRSSAE
jgi:hypothetical protein